MCRFIPIPLLLLLAAALALRLAGLEWRPPHHDEAVNGWFVDQMWTWGYYPYDPGDYHGPLHFYVLFVFLTVAGVGLWQLRLPTVLAGVGAIFLLFKFERFQGRRTAFLACLAMTVSPAYLYYSRYAIHEIWLVLFLLLTLLGFFGLWLGKGRKSDLWMLAMGVTGMVLTKETYLMHLVCLALAWPTLLLWEKFFPSSAPEPVNAGPESETPGAPGLVTRSDVLQAAAVSLLIIVVVYSGFFQAPAHVAGVVTTFLAWFTTGFEGGHAKRDFEWWGLNYYWVYLMLRFETPAFLGLVAGVYYLFRGDRMSRYLAIYAAGTLCAYTIVPYKTPWCIVAFLWPFYLMAADVAGRMGRWRPWCMGLLAVAMGFSFHQAWRLNYHEYTNEQIPYVYVQTYTDVYDIVAPVEDLTDRMPEQKDLRGLILTTDYYPLPWMLRGYSRIGYFGENWPEEISGADFILVTQTDADRLEARLREPYYRLDYRLRDAAPRSRAYYRASVFADYFGGAAPDFVPEVP